MENSQPRLLPANLIILILHGQSPRRIIQHPSNLPFRIEVEIPSRWLRSLRICRSDRMQVYPSIGWNASRSLSGALHRIHTRYPRSRAIRLNLRLGNEIGSGVLFLFSPAAHLCEHRLDRILRRGIVALACAQRGKLGAIVFFAQAVLEAILAIAVGTTDGGVFEGINEGFANDVGTLVGVVYVGFLDRGAVLLLGCRVAVEPARPFACVGAFVGCFAAVIEAEGAAAGFASEWEEI